MKKNWKKQLTISALALTLATGNAASVFGAPAPDGQTDAAVMAEQMGLTSQWNRWKSSWNREKNDWTKISLSPGKDASEINFAWYTPKNTDDSRTNKTVAAKVAELDAAKSEAPKLIIGEGRNMKHAKVYEAKQTTVSDETDSSGNTYDSNKVTAVGLKENTTYYYSYDNGSGYTDPEPYQTKSDDNFSFVFVGDPQIGSSNELKGSDTEEFYNAQSDAVRSDAFNWSATLNAAMEKTGNKASFVVSAGDQIQTTKKKAPNKDAAKSEIEYTGYLSPSILKSLPVATTVGNHDADNPNYTYHFYPANQSDLGSNHVAGGDYYFKYGGALFLMLNTQDTNVAEHKQFIEQTIAANKDCKWRVVTLHQDIYGSAEHSNEPEITNLRYQLTPIFEDYDVDVVLTGHDHAYSRSKMMLADAPSEIAKSYTDDEFSAQLEKDMDAGENPKTRYEALGNIKDNTADLAEQKYLAYLKSIMDEKSVETVRKQGDSVINPEGILYMTGGSSSGSKYYDLVPRKQAYIAARWQEDVPTYSVVNVTENALTINTYRTDNDQKIDETFSIVKNKGDQTSLNSEIRAAESAVKAKNSYTASSYKAFEQALAGAKKIAGDRYATKTEIENAGKALMNAKAALVKKPDLKKAAVSAIKTRTYTGKKQTPAVTVKVNGKTLKKDRDYTVSYSNHINTGRASVKITAKGDYVGSKTVFFNIQPKKASASVKASRKRIRVKIKKSAGKVSGYQIKFAANKSFKKAKIKNTAKTTYTLKSLKSGKRYYVKVRAFKTVQGKRLYGTYSKTMKVTVKS